MKNLRIMKWILLSIICLLTVDVRSQIISTFAGNGTASGVSGDGGAATAASINAANGGAFDKYGNYYVAEVLGHKVRKITPIGIITTVAGIATSGYNGDGMLATTAKLNSPTAIAVDTQGNIYIDDASNFRIRKMEFVTGLISTVAGTGVSGYNGDNIPATTAQLGGVQDLCIDKFGNLYIADQVNYRIRKISTDGTITTVAGSGTFSGTGTGDGGPATNATFNWLAGIVVDTSGNLFIADMNTARVRKVNTLGVITTIAGNGAYTYSGDNIPATNAQINPIRLAFDRSNNLVIADKFNRRILKIDDAGIIHSIAGNGISGYGGDGGPATGASFDFPAGVVYDTCGNLYVAESSNRRVRKITFNPTCPSTTSINNHSISFDAVVVYPDPTTSSITLSAPYKIEEIIIRNTIGQVVYQQYYYAAKQTQEIDVSHLPAGIYFARVNGAYTSRFVKQ